MKITRKQPGAKIEIPAALTLDTRLKPMEHLTYELLALFAGKNGVVAITAEQLAEARGINTRTLQLSLNRLERHGWISRRRGRKNRRIVTLTRPSGQE